MDDSNFQASWSQVAISMQRKPRSWDAEAGGAAGATPWLIVNACATNGTEDAGQF